MHEFRGDRLIPSWVLLLRLICCSPLLTFKVAASKLKLRLTECGVQVGGNFQFETPWHYTGDAQNHQISVRVFVCSVNI